VAMRRAVALTFLAMMVVLLIGLGWELHARAEVRKARGDYIAALQRFEQKAKTPAEMERLPWAAQYLYLKSKVYPQRQEDLDAADQALKRVKQYKGKILEPGLRSRLGDYIGVANRLLTWTEEMWANEKEIDAAYFARDWGRRQELALDRSALGEKGQELVEAERRKWEKTGL